MNKKKLSVVMAGAMLASSVAPVLAAETTADKKYEVSANELGTLKKEIREFLATKTFHMSDVNPNEDLANKSVYYFTTNLDTTHRKNADDGTIANLTAGQKLYVWSEGVREDENKNYFSTKKATEGVKEGKYTLDRMVKDAEWFNDTNNTGKPAYTVAHKIIKGMDVDKTNKELKVQLLNGKVLTYTTESYIVAFEQPTINGYKVPASKIEDNVASIDGFAEKVDESSVGTNEDIANELLAEITITPGGYNLAVEDLYDGLMLTEEGHDFFSMIKDARDIGRSYKVYGSAGNTELTADNQIDGNIVKNNAGKTVFFVELGAKGNLAAEKYTITGSDLANTRRLATWLLEPQARVDILAGANRYETAVEIAKEYAGLTDATTSYTGDYANIVLVNGNSLVDGLAASPLAAILGTDSAGNDASQHKAPILLTEADALPKATKAYLKEVLGNVQIGNLKGVTIHLVGGESVLNKSLERELKGLGFNVERYGGDNREETSLEVAEAINELKDSKSMTSTNEAFVVGAEGEADAMSIAAVASTQKTPIIVAKKGGITEDATYELRNKEVTVIGGENAVSTSDYKSIKAEAKGVQRIAGSNRQETNAEIISKYYKANFSAGVGSAENVIVAKDGKGNKGQLVDALAAANMAATKKAPIVLATDKLSKSQINALELNATGAKTLYQVGIGVSRDVVKTIAENLGLSNR